MKCPIENQIFVFQTITLSPPPFYTDCHLFNFVRINVNGPIIMGFEGYGGYTEC